MIKEYSYIVSYILHNTLQSEMRKRIGEKLASNQKIVSHSTSNFFQSTYLVVIYHSNGELVWVYHWMIIGQWLAERFLAIKLLHWRNSTVFNLTQLQTKIRILWSVSKTMSPIPGKFFNRKLYTRNSCFRVFFTEITIDQYWIVLVKLMHFDFKSNCLTPKEWQENIWKEISFEILLSSLMAQKYLMPNSCLIIYF